MITSWVDGMRRRYGKEHWQLMVHQNSESILWKWEHHYQIRSISSLKHQNLRIAHNENEYMDIHNMKARLELFPLQWLA